MSSILPRLIVLPVLVCLVMTEASLLRAEDLVTTDGKTYKNIRISSETPDKIKVMHDGGITMVPKSTLSAAFLINHELKAPPISQTTVESNPQEAALPGFKATTPMFKTKDGREFRSADIMSIDAAGMKIGTSAGIVRLAFNELPEKIRAALNYDAVKAAEFETRRASKQQEDNEIRQRLSGAASTVDMFGKRVRLILLQNQGKGWICAGDILKDVDVNVVTKRQGSVFSGPKVVTEISKQTDTVVVGEIDRVMVFGLPSYGTMSADAQGRRTWTGHLYRVGNYKWVSASSGSSQTIDASHIDRGEAIRWTAKNGNAITYTAKGMPEEAPLPPVVSGTASGTGFAITDAGHVATAAHVVEGSSEIHVMIGELSKTAQILAIDKELDVAILKVDGAKTKPLSVLPAKSARIGDNLFSVGYPLIGQLGMNAKLTKGTLNAMSGLGDDIHTFQMSVQIQPGNSGGPVCDDLGHVIGVVSKTTSTIAAARGDAGAVPQNVNFAVRGDELLKLAKSINLDLPKTIPAVESPTQRVLDSTYLIKVELGEPASK